MTSAALISRLAVVASSLLAIAVGLRTLTPRPLVLATLLVVFVGAAAAARSRFQTTAKIILLFTYVSYGIARLVGGPDLAAIPFWLAGLIGLVLGGIPWTRWQAVDGWRVPLAWWATTVAITWPAFAARELGYSHALSSAANPIVTAALLQMSIALWMDHLLAADGERQAPRPGATDPWWSGPLLASATVTALAAVYQHVFDFTWLSHEPWVTLQRSVGLMGDANPMGVATAVWAPLAWTMAGRGLAGTGLRAVALLLWAAAWFSGARTTLVLIMGGAVGLALVWANGRNLSRRAILAAAAAAGVLVVGSVAIVAPRAAPGTPVGRLLGGSISTSSLGDATYELFWRRDGYGLAAVEAIREHPIVGVGVGRFFDLSPTYHQRAGGRAIPPDNAQNFWRQHLAEQGVLGLLPILWLTFLAARSLLGPLTDRGDLMRRVVLASLGVALMFGYPLQDAGIAVTVATLAATLGRARHLRAERAS
ncbi:MAG: hypothetical protein OEW19_23135 [Acidobacteriota bacterium]|nr:hypothetical protein [Acidobacteriota bacterium]